MKISSWSTEIIRLISSSKFFYKLNNVGVSQLIVQVSPPGSSPQQKSVLTKPLGIEDRKSPISRLTMSPQHWKEYQAKLAPAAHQEEHKVAAGLQ